MLDLLHGFFAARLASWTSNLEGEIGVSIAVWNFSSLGIVAKHAIAIILQQYVTVATLCNGVAALLGYKYLKTSGYRCMSGYWYMYRQAGYQTHLRV